MRAPDPLVAAHPDLGSVSVRPYGQGRWLIDLAGPDAVRRLHAEARLERPQWQSCPGWSSLLITAPDAQRLLDDLCTLSVPEHDERIVSDTVVIDVVYDGVDLPAVAHICNLTVDEVVGLHTAARYQVVFLGFTRGFAYLDGLDPLLAAVPRLATPRVRVPSGSVGIAAGQTGIYPMDSPGGWHLLGHTTVELFDGSRMPPSLVEPGDRVQFRAVGS